MTLCRLIIVLEVVDMVKISGIVVDFRETEKGAKLVSVADSKAVHTVMLDRDFIFTNEMKGKEMTVEGVTNDPVFLFASRNGNGKK